MYGRNKKFTMQAYGGNLVHVNWWGSMVFDTAGFTQKEKIPALLEHQRDKRAGVLEDFWVEDGKYFSRGFLLDNNDGQEVSDLLRQGFPIQCSVSIQPITIQKVEEGETISVNEKDFQGPFVCVREGRITEISFCSLGADSETGVGEASGGGDFWSLVSQHQKKADCSRADAIRYIAEIRPELHDRYVLSLSGQKPANVENTKNKSEFMTLVENHQRQHNVGKAEAVRAIVAAYPQVHQQYLESRGA